MAQRVVVVQVLVAQRLAMDALGHHGLDAVHATARIAPVAKAARHHCGQANGAVGLAQQQRPGIRGNRPAIELSHNLAASERFKDELSVATVCWHRLSPSIRASDWSHNHFL